MKLFGRRKIYTANEMITAENVIDELNAALSYHFVNVQEMDYLYWYRRGVQPILNRKKEVRPEINNKVVENIASEIVAFKNGYFLTQPTFYVARKKGDELTDKLNQLNDYLYLSGKTAADNEVVDWFHTCGLGVIYVDAAGEGDIPAKAYAIDPRQAFVVYSRRPGNAPVMGVNMVVTGKDNGTTKLMFDVFTKTHIFHISGEMTGPLVSDGELISLSTAVNIESIEANALGEIPIIEYQYDYNRMGAFEGVESLLKNINAVQSNRVDGIEQFISSLLVFYNCALGEDEEGNPITPAYIRQAGAIFLKSIGQDKADLKEIAEQLDQTQTQVLIDDFMLQICSIAGVPLQTQTKSGTSDNTGAVYLRSGWATADTFARNTEDLFKISNKRFDRVFFKILKLKTGLDILPSDVDIQFTRNEMDNLLVKTQGALNLKQLGLAPELVLAKSGVSNDPAGDVARSKEYIDAAYRQETAQPETEIVDYRIPE